MKKIVLLMAVSLMCCASGYSENAPSVLAIKKIKEIAALKQGKSTEANIVEVVKKHYGDGEWQVRLATVELIGAKLTYDPDVIYIIKKALRDDSDDVKIAAIQKIPSVYYDKAIVEYLATELLGHPNYEIRAFAAKSLAEYAQSTSALLISAKEKIANDQHPDVKGYAKEIEIRPLN